MLFLGVASLDHNSAAALLNADGILGAVEEEKLNRSVGADNFPRLAMIRCLEQQGARVSDLNLAALADLPQEARLRESGLGSQFWANRKRKSAKDSRKSSSIRQLRQHLSGAVKLQQFEHHLCHAASSFYTSEFDRALILTLDSGAGSRCGQVSLGEGDEIRPLRAMNFPDSLGWFYSRITALLGFRPSLEEHKTQWLGRQGQPEYLPVFRKLFRSDSHGLPQLDRRYF